MANRIPTWSSNTATCRTNIASTLAAANNGDTIQFTNQGGSGVWNLAGFSDGTENLTTATGAIEVTKNVVLILDAGVTIAEDASNPLQGDYQTLIRFKGCTGCGITFFSGSKLLGAKAAHAGDATTEWLAGCKFVGCSNIAVTGTNEVHFDSFYGDGLWFASGAYDSLGANTGISVVGVKSQQNYRNGITVEDGIGTLTNIGCDISNFGTSPQAFLGLETDNTSDTIQITVNNAVAVGRAHTFYVNIADSLSSQVQITYNNCRALRSTVVGDNPWGFCFIIPGATTVPSGSYIRLNACEANNLKSAGFRWGTVGVASTVNYPLDSNMTITLNGCVARNCSTNNLDNPYDFALRNNPTGGGVIFNGCECIDDMVRNATTFSYNLIRTPTFATDTDWTKGTGWSITSGVGRAAAGSASDLSQTVAPLVTSTTYFVQFTVSNYSGGTIVAKCGTQAGTSRSANGTYSEQITSNGTGFLFTKDASGAFDIDNVIVYPMTGATNIRGLITAVNSAGLRTLEQGNALLPRLNVVPVGRPRFSNKAKTRRSANRGAL